MSVIEPKFIKDLTKLCDGQPQKFYIPNYQRGYRWDEAQVDDLLNDIHDFKEDYYCLQPVVVSKDEKENRWELIDGQQRLTTIHIILTYLKEYLPKTQSYSLDFETRPQSQDFLANKLKNILQPDDSNIDFYYISQAFIYIKNWFEEKSEDDDSTNVANKFHLRLLNQVQIIWYEVDTLNKKERIDIFTRLNMGKIPLTNAELIKALLLQEGNFKKISIDKNYIKHRQFEIAHEWDAIEYALQKNDFWYFICKDKDFNDKYPTRIEFIFDLISNKKENADGQFTFLDFETRLKEKQTIEEKKEEEQAINLVWKDVKNYFMTLQEWFHNKELYHYIGFLISIGESISTLKTEQASMTKTQFLEYLKTHIAGKMSKDINTMGTLLYGKKSQVLQNILLLYNIETIVQSSNASLLFPFESYKNKKWSLEHIHAQNAQELRTETQWLDWLNEHKEYLEGIKIPDKITKEEFDDLSQKAYETYTKSGGQNLGNLEENNTISNLALLSSEVNSALSNSFFPIKRKKIIEKEKAGEFIPLCTKHVFMKYDSEDVAQMSFWSERDQKDYFRKIEDTLSIFNGRNDE